MAATTALRGALSATEDAVSALLAHAGALGADTPSLLRRIDAVAVALQRARSLVAAPCEDAFALLPLEVQSRILALLPCDALARAAAVRRAWRAAIHTTRAWTALNLSPASGLSLRATDAVLRGAAARAAAAGGLRSLDVSRCGGITHAALLEVVTAHAATLVHFRRVNSEVIEDDDDDDYVYVPQLRLPELRALLHAAPQLPFADVSYNASLRHDALALLRRQGTFSRLRLHDLCLIDGGEVRAPPETVLGVLNAFEHYEPPLPELHMQTVDLSGAAAMEALTRACARTSTLRAIECDLDLRISTGASPVALGRFFSLCSTLTGLHLDGCNFNSAMLDGGAAALLAAALPASNLTSITLARGQLFHDPAVGIPLLAALTGHRSMRAIDVSGNGLRRIMQAEVPGALDNQNAAIGAALAALVAANSPALKVLDISYNSLGNGLTPIYAALAQNSHLCTLLCIWNTVRPESAAVLQAALQTNLGLRKLRLIAEDCAHESGRGSYIAPPAALQAEALVAQRV